MNDEQMARNQIVDILTKLDPRLRVEVIEHLQTGEESFFERLSDRPGDLAEKTSAMKVIRRILGHLDPTTRNRLLASISVEGDANKRDKGGHGTT